MEWRRSIMIYMLLFVLFKKGLTLDLPIAYFRLTD